MKIYQYHCTNIELNKSSFTSVFSQPGYRLAFHRFSPRQLHSVCVLHLSEESSTWSSVCVFCNAPSAVRLSLKHAKYSLASANQATSTSVSSSWLFPTHMPFLTQSCWTKISSCLHLFFNCCGTAINFSDNRINTNGPKRGGWGGAMAHLQHTDNYPASDVCASLSFMFWMRRRCLHTDTNTKVRLHEFSLIFGCCACGSTFNQSSMWVHYTEGLS